MDHPQPSFHPHPRQTRRTQIRAVLHHRATLRQAVLVAEILARPVMRRSSRNSQSLRTRREEPPSTF